MSVGSRVISLLALSLLPLAAFAAAVPVESDSAALFAPVADTSGTVFVMPQQAEPDSQAIVRESVIVRRERAFDPTKAAWYAAVCPGLGQIYNRQYWKLPVVYGGFVGLGYAVVRLNSRYVSYHKAYVDITDSDSHTNAYERVLDGVTLDDSNREYYTRVFKSYQDSYRRYRDLCIAGVGVWYMLTILDAYVDAQMRDYDITPDLSFKVRPAALPLSGPRTADTALGLTCKFRIR